MLSRPLLNRIVGDEALVRGLCDPEARVLIEWLVDRAEEGAEAGPAEQVVLALCRRGRAIGKFVALWTEGARAAAVQLAASERFAWPLPAAALDPCVLMQNILAWEDREARRPAPGDPFPRN